MSISYRLSNQVSRNAFIKLGSELIGRLASFILLLWAARQLGETGFGRYNFALAWGFVLAQIADLGLQLLISREVAVQKQTARPLILSALRLKIALSVIVLLLLGIIATLQPPEIGFNLFLIGLMPLTNTFLEFAAHIFRGQERLNVESRLIASTRVVTAVAGFLVLWAGGGLPGLALTNLFAAILFTLWAYRLLKKEGWLRKGDSLWLAGATQRVSLTDQALFKQTLPLGIAIFLSIAYTRLAIFMLQNQLGETAVAHFSAAYRLVEPAQIIPASLLAALFPIISRTLKQNPQQTRQIVAKTTGAFLLLGGSIALGFWLTAPKLIELLYAPPFINSVPILQTLGLSLIFSFVNYGLTHILVALNQQKIITLFTATMLILHGLLSWQLIPRWGAVGPAISIIVAEAFLFIACLITLVGRRPGKLHKRASQAKLSAREKYRSFNAWIKPVRSIGFYSLILLALTLPFEMERPLLLIGPLILTNVEILQNLAIVAAFGSWILERQSSAQKQPQTAIPRSWLWLGILFSIGLIVTSLLAPELKGNALKASLRTINGLLLLPATLQLARRETAVRKLMAALVIGGLIAGLIGLAEHIIGTPFAWVTLFRAHPSVAGSFLRLAGPFDYTNQAAMYIEATLPLLFAFSFHKITQRYLRLPTPYALLLPLLYLQISFLTFSRASFGTHFIIFLLMAAVLGFFQTRRNAQPLIPNLQSQMPSWKIWGGAATAVLLLIIANYLFSATFRIRLSSEDETSWYQAKIDAPASITIGADDTQTVPITVHNNGSLIWLREGDTPIKLGARWKLVQAAGEELTYQPRWAFEKTIKPGKTATMQVPLRAPIKGGDYELIWDIVHENVTWFGMKGNSEARTAVTVVGDAVFNPDRDNTQVSVTSHAVAAQRDPIPGRLTLWKAALTMLKEHPLSGIGLDNYRLLYGRYTSSSPVWNETIHTNNWYIETLVSLGPIAALPTFIWLLLLLLDFWRTLSQPSVTIFQTGIAVSLLAFIVHGLLDYFMLFNATALLFWLLVALWLQEKNLALQSK